MRDILGDLEQFEPGEKDPVRRAQAAMKVELPKRFYKSVAVEKTDNGYAIALDGRRLKTPAKKTLEVPEEKWASALAKEWDAQETHIDPARMPLTRMVNTALDGVSLTMEAVRAEIAAFAGSDLLCYRADAPEGLVERQSELWDGALEKMRARYGARFNLAEGVMHVEQPAESLEIVAETLAAEVSPIRLAGLHVATSLTGSVILPLLVASGDLSVQDAWDAAHVDEDWNIAQWGEDAEAAARRKLRREEFGAATFLLSPIGDN